MDIRKALKEAREKTELKAAQEEWLKLLKDPVFKKAVDGGKSNYLYLWELAFHIGCTFGTTLLAKTLRDKYEAEHEVPGVG